MENSAQTDCPAPKGILVIIGGKEDKGKQQDDKNGEQNNTTPEILETFIKLIEKDDPVVEVITTASSEEEELFEEYRQVFKKMNVTQVAHIHHEAHKEVIKDAPLAERIQNADAFFFTGGNQLLLTSLYGGTFILTQIKQRFIDEKIVVGGTSAGAMALSTPMIYAGNKEKQQITGEIKITTGLEFLKDVCIDTHFIDRSRFVRMAQVIATNPTCIGVGVEEDTAIVVHDGSKAEVIGKGIVTIIEGFAITNSNIDEFGDDQVVSIQNLTVHLLSKGNFYDVPKINPVHR